MFRFSPNEKRAFSPTLALAAVAVLAALALIAVAALWATRETPPPDEGETMTFVGHVTDVRARSLIELESLRVTDASGASLRFHADDVDGFREFGPKPRARAYADGRTRGGDVQRGARKAAHRGFGRRSALAACAFLIDQTM